MEQITMFGSVPYKVPKNHRIRLIELFAGVGSQAMALRDIGADFEHYRVVEFDKYAIASYNAIHGTDFPVMDIRDVHGSDLGIKDKEHFTYLLTYSFPCTDLSVAGKMAGMVEGSNTRSSLLWEVKRLLTECDELPQILMMENVPQVHGKKNKGEFDRWLDFLKDLGYTSFWQDMNAKDYGVAQSRKRTIVISLLGNYEFAFPTPITLQQKMRDYLEAHVDEKYYLRTDKARKLIDTLIADGKLPKTVGGHPCQLDKTPGGKSCALEDAKMRSIDEDYAGCITSRYYKGIHASGDNLVLQTEILGGAEPTSLSTNNPELLDIANCVSARTDRGISTRRNEGSGVVEWMRLE